MTVVVVGDALLDVTVRPESPMRAGADVPAAIQIGPGGQGANVAVRLVRQGVDVELVCALAGDAASRLLRAALEIEGLRLQTIATPATGCIVILLGTDGQRTMLSQRTPFAAAAGHAIPPDAPWLLISGYLLSEPDVASFVRSLAALRARRVVLGCAVPAGSTGAWRAALASLRPDLVVLNTDEAAALEPWPSETGVVVTDAGGASATIGGISAKVRASTGSPATDTTGAGDAFAAGLIASLREVPWPPSTSALESALADALELASAVARTAGAQGRVAGERAAIMRP